MESLKYLYKIGPGPSSSHTIGPSLASEYIKKKYKDASNYQVTLYGSLALTGKGHLTDVILKKSFAPKECEVVFDKRYLPRHPNGMIFKAYKGKRLIGKEIVYSVGGGRFEVKGDIKPEHKRIYKEKDFTEIKEYCKKHKCNLVSYVKHYEPNIEKYLEKVFDTMVNTIERGLKTKGSIPGSLHLERVASSIYEDALKIKDEYEHNKMLITAYAYATSEENACGNEIVCAPTCGAAGVFPSLLYFFYHDLKTPKKKIIEALMVGGVIGNVVKKNATISGAEGGCQAEVGTACSMASAGVAYLLKQDISRIEYAAEVAMEHHLGLTCDPVRGYVQIPCIERNGVAALRAYDAALYGKYVARHRVNRVSFDAVNKVMKETGKNLRKEYRETALGGLASELKEDK